MTDIKADPAIKKLLEYASEKKRISYDEVNDFLYYLGWAELNSAEDEEVWKIRRIRKVGSVWYQEYAYGNQFYRYKWSERSTYPYA